MSDENVETLVIGGGQAGLAVGYHLARRSLPFLIVDANERVGDAWRNRWDSLRLFTPARFDGLPGMPYPGPRWAFPTKDEFADYLERYAKDFDLPVRTGVRVERLVRNGQRRFVATAGDSRLEADNVVVAMSSWQRPRVPEFASDLDPGIVQLHAADYRNPGQLLGGEALVVGVGNSGAEIALELSKTHRVWLSGRPFGVLPFRPASPIARVLMPLLGRVIFHRVLTTSTPIGRRARPKMLAGDPLIRVKPKDLAKAGVERVPRTTGVVEGQPQLEDGRRLDVENVVWCTGFRPGFSWIDVPGLGSQEPKHRRGIVEEEPGLYFVGLKFLYAKSSEQIHGVGRDAAHIADHIAAGHRKPLTGTRAPA